ncbi:hypothetical protein XELAEV_18012144mg [Xenopus laevis]|uniref:Platelet-activating factor acetylhydrolase n=1 Tax=Xenopus laevis TaxID=8355 RepID=A0A974HY41_XENLA|nr:hypothetical protein XELAEV_18012144mg [Xenopus laevis]
MGVQLSLKLPPVTGPHPVSCTDIMVGHSKEGSFFRLFYPCGSSHDVQYPMWLPRSEYVTALAKYLGWDSSITPYISSLIFGHPQVPVPWSAPFVTGVDKKPLIIFSHGLGAFRTVYSALCMQLASHGFLVAALEHRDGSACATYHFADDDPTNAPLKEVWVPFSKVEVGMKEFYLRNYQLHHRANECVRVIQILRDINAGAVFNVLKSDFDLQALKGRMDFNNVAIMGHSFGGASTLLSLAKDDTLRCAIALDAWMFPLEDASYTNIQKPILFINAEHFQTTSSIQKMKRLNAGNRESKAITILGSVHHSLSDSAFLSGFLADRILQPRAKLNPEQCLQATITSALSFLQKHLDLPGNIPSLDSLSEEIRACILSDFPITNSSKL